MLKVPGIFCALDLLLKQEATSRVTGERGKIKAFNAAPCMSVCVTAWVCIHFCTSGKYDLLTNGEIKKIKMYVCKHESCVLATVPLLNSN